MQTVEQSSTTTFRVVTFPVGKLTLAVPIESVYRVLSEIPVEGSGERGVGVAHLEDYELTVFDLEYQLFTQKPSEPISAPAGSYLVVVQSQSEVLGLLVKQAPTLMNLSRDRVRVLPQSYRQADTLTVCSHVAVLEAENQSSNTVFLLDVEQLFQH
ncbi:chemotaxis protein CheW [Euhalothece natronophila Z-M001]|uniref:Chemotaxis protein CheW n=1 Tax=Euhalothece natronophila Z-M001 TaxID=522448 RepID=A0A5B8NPK4_9CHRO|nr:chemotaxis protein CheW [Euhalothece natronophila]QDZ40075.1 chemotaxis protein CheW [Euhalothece natronophila Z-M001]